MDFFVTVFFFKLALQVLDGTKLSQLNKMIYCIIKYLNVQKRYKPVAGYHIHSCEKHPVTA